LRKCREGRLVATPGIDLEQLDPYTDPVRLKSQGLLEDLLGLLFAPVGDIDIGLGDRVDLV